jgi:hypothetical protein
MVTFTLLYSKLDHLQSKQFYISNIKRVSLLRAGMYCHKNLVYLQPYCLFRVIRVDVKDRQTIEQRILDTNVGKQLS